LLKIFINCIFFLKPLPSFKWCKCPNFLLTVNPFLFRNPP